MIHDQRESDQLSINTIRTLSIDAVQQAKSGPPRTPMALAPLVYTIWNRVMRFDPKDPIWPNRDRFVLSNGHASMLLWSVLHLTGTQAVNADYERLGQPSVTPRRYPPVPPARQQSAGPPEYHWVSGVEATTGPLGKASPRVSAWPSPRSGSPTATTGPASIFSITNLRGLRRRLLMEGVASEAASLAGHLQLDNLCWIYDNNHITIEGNTRIAFTEDTLRVSSRTVGMF